MYYLRIFNSRLRSYNVINPQSHGWCFSPTITTKQKLSILEVISELIFAPNLNLNQLAKFCSILLNFVQWLFKLFIAPALPNLPIRLWLLADCIRLRILIYCTNYKYDAIDYCVMWKFLIHANEVIMQLPLNAMVGVSHRPLLRSCSYQSWKCLVN